MRLWLKNKESLCALLVKSLWETVWKFLKKLRIELHVIQQSHFGVSPKEIKSVSGWDIHSSMFTVALFIITKIWKQSYLSEVQALAKRRGTLCGLVTLPGSVRPAHRLGPLSSAKAWLKRQISAGGAQGSRTCPAIITEGVRSPGYSQPSDGLFKLERINWINRSMCSKCKSG